MNSTKKTARIVAVLLLLTIIIGILINQFLQGPIVFSKDFLTKVSANSNQIIISTVLGVVTGALGVGIAVILLPIFAQYKRLSYLYFGFSLIGFAIILIDNVSVLSILGLSQEYVNAEASAADELQTLGTILFQTRWWTHYTMLLISGLPLFMFYYLFFLTKLIPRFISVWGLIGVLMLFTEVLLSFFGQGIGMILFLPLGLVQILMVIWLLIKGFNTAKV
jgi:hypothetical protein